MPGFRNRRALVPRRETRVSGGEPLEPRMVLSGNPLLSRTWTIVGDTEPSQPDDVIVVERDPDVGGQLRATVNGRVVSTRSEDGVRTIRIRAGRGNDTVSISIPGNTAITSVIDGGFGDDSITGGEAADIIRGGKGRDTLVGGDGNDRMWGGADDDSLAGSAGDDFLYGDAGADVIRGGGGRNSLVGGAGIDLFNGDASRDRMRMGRGERLIGDESTNPLAPVVNAAALADWYVAAAFAQWGGQLGQRSGWGYPPGTDGRVVALAGSTATGLAIATQQPRPDFDGTNNQVAGVDEGDLVKTDGTHIYALGGGGVDIVAVESPAAASLVSHLDLPGQERALFLHGTRLTVIGEQGEWFFAPQEAASGFAARILPYQGSWQARVTVSVVDVADAANPTVVETSSLDGFFLDARAVDGRVLVVTRDGIDMPAPAILPDAADGAAAVAPPVIDAATDAAGFATAVQACWIWPTPSGTYEDAAAYRARLEAAWAAGPLPKYEVTTAAGVVAKGTLVVPGSTHVPRDPTADASMLSLTAFTVDDDTPGFDAVTSVAGVSGTVYATTSSLYVAASHWGAWWDGTDSAVTTNVYKFDVSNPALPLTAMGAVPGTTLNQMSLDEHDGLLRIATTSWNQTGSSNGVFVLAESAGNLGVVGSVTNLAAGEQIYSVRFVGDVGYVCTFRQIDPLFVIDLADPAAPRVAGELKIPGYSSILQPLDASHILGIGRDVDADTGRVKGLQLSLFDVGDPAAPRRTATYTFAGDGWQSWSPALWDHKAVGSFASHGILALPVEQGDWNSRSSGLSVFRIDVGTDALEKLGEVASADPVLRSVRIGETLFTISATEVIVTPLRAPSEVLARVRLTQAQDEPPVIRPLEG